MHKFLSVHYIYLIPLLASAISSLRAFRQNWPKQYRYFSVFLFLTLFVELFALLWKWYLHSTTYWTYSRFNYWIYDPFVIVKLLFYVWFFRNIIAATKVNVIINIALVPVLLLGVAELFVINFYREANTLTIAAGNLFLVSLTLLFFRQLIREATTTTLWNNPAVYIATGVLIYHSATTPLFIYLNVLNSQNPSLSTSYFYINHIFNIIMYSLFLTSFICKPYFRR